MICTKTAVDAAWVYFNRGDLADQLQRARRSVDEDRHEPQQDRRLSVKAVPNSEVPRRVVDRLGEDVVPEIVEARRAGMKLKDVAAQYGISESSVKRVLRAHASRESVRELGISGIPSDI